MPSILKSMSEFAAFCRKADVIGQPRLSITFDNPRDAAWFEREVTRELGDAARYISAEPPLPSSEYQMYGIHMRIIA